MIGCIRGILVASKPPEILVQVGGVGYEIQVPMSTAWRLPEIGRELQLHTHFAVRDDAQLLYGFSREKDKLLFRALIRVNGVGPKMALAILSGMDADEFVGAVQNNALSALTSMPGVGKKTAERLLVEMRDRLAEWGDGAAVTPTAAAGQPAASISREAETALVSLGYKPAEASRAITRVLQQHPDTADSESLIRLVLKGMV